MGNDIVTQPDFGDRCMILDPNSPKLDVTRPLSPRALLGSALSSFKSRFREVF